LAEGHSTPMMPSLRALVDSMGNSPSPGEGKWPVSMATHHPAGFDFGFGGAQVMELEKLQDAGGSGNVVFFGVDKELRRHFGDANPGAATFVRKNTFCMMPWTQAHAGACHDIGIVNADEPQAVMQDVIALSDHLTKLGLRPVLIGCDHTASVANVMGMIQGGRSALTYLYFDAHFDMGMHSQAKELHNGSFVDLLRRTEQVAGVVNVGGRSWAIFDPVYTGVPKFVCVPGGVPHMTAAELIERLSWLKATSLYVSIDADVLDPSCAPNTSCPEPFGMMPAELFALCGWLGESCEVIGGDLCEVIPSDTSRGSEQALMRCLHALFPKRVG
jgi:agmatinase